MSSTNKTTNYELSQFVGSDKPAWLSDYNQDMSKIDGGIHTAQTTATGADGKADANTTNIGDLTHLSTTTKNNLVAAVNELDSNVETAQSTANAANATASGCRTDINKFDLTNLQTFTPNSNVGTMDSETQVQFAVDNTNSVFKVYGRARISGLSGISGSLILKLGTTNLNPTTTYYINSGATIYVQNTSNQYIAIGSRNLKITTNGDIYVVSGTSDDLLALSGTPSTIDVIMSPCLYFNKNFGDQ